MENRVSQGNFRSSQRDSAFPPNWFDIISNIIPTVVETANSSIQCVQKILPSERSVNLANNSHGEKNKSVLKNNRSLDNITNSVEDKKRFNKPLKSSDEEFDPAIRMRCSNLWQHKHVNTSIEPNKDTTFSKDKIVVLSRVRERNDLKLFNCYDNHVLILGTRALLLGAVASNGESAQQLWSMSIQHITHISIQFESNR